MANILKDYDAVVKNIRTRSRGMSGMTGNHAIDDATIKVVASHWVTHFWTVVEEGGKRVSGFEVPSNQKLRELISRFGGGPL